MIPSVERPRGEVISSSPPSKRLALADAISRFVRPGMHLHWASTPSRSNAAIREVARAYLGQKPGFTFSATGFHSLGHLLPLLGLGRRYISCFYGDNCPTPRPNPLYTRLAAEGAELEHWSVLSYVAALRAGALGHRYGVVRSLSGSSLGQELAKAGRYVELPDPQDEGHSVGLVAALRPDLCFIHALAADEHGRALFSPPSCEGMWGALAAKQGVIVTAEEIVSAEALDAHPEGLVLAPSRVLAVCEEPFGAHPQPLYAVPSLGRAGYRDDQAHYQLWRQIAAHPEELASFRANVLEAKDGQEAYRAFVGRERMKRLRMESGQRLPPPARVEPTVAALPPTDSERMILLAARQITQRVKAAGYRQLLAGVGQAFFACRLAKHWLLAEGIELEVIVETGILDLECGSSADGFLLAYENLAQAGRLSHVEDALGALTCGEGNRTLGVIGSAQVDREGNVNSTRLADGRLLVGSGGANDIASCADEVVVLAACSKERLVERVDHVTSPGRSVRCIVTERGCLVRESSTELRWQVENLVSDGGTSFQTASQEVLSRCGFALEIARPQTFAAPFTAPELALLRSLDPEGIHTRRTR